MGGRLTADFRRFYGLPFPPELGAREVADLAAYLPPESATFRHLDPRAVHSNESELLRSVEYSLRWLVWAKTKDGSKGRNMPEPITFPWEQAKAAFEFDVMTTGEVDALLGWDAEFQAIVPQPTQ